MTSLGSMHCIRRRGALAALGLVGMALVCAGLATGQAQADPRTDYLIRLLRSSSQFRVRAQAAVSLGRPPGDAKSVQALTGALKDGHPAVRAAAATALERLGDPAALGALRRMANDKEGPVRQAARRAIARLERVARGRPDDAVARRGKPSRAEPARYYVGVGMPGSKVSDVSVHDLARAREFIVRKLSEIQGVMLAPKNEDNRAAQRVLKKRSLTGFFVDSAIVDVQESSTGMRVVVSVIVGTYPGRDMRAVLQGAATVPGGSGAAAKVRAIEGALNGALRRLPQAFAAANR